MHSTPVRPSWAAPTGPCTVLNTSVTGANSSMRSLRIFGACGHYQGTRYDLGGSQPTGLTFWVRTDSSTFARAYVVLGDDNVASNNGAVFFSALNSGYWAVGTGTHTFNLAPVVVGQWFRVDLVLDWVGKTVDISIDGGPEKTITIDSGTSSSSYATEINAQLDLAGLGNKLEASVVDPSKDYEEAVRGNFTVKTTDPDDSELTIRYRIANRKRTSKIRDRLRKTRKKDDMRLNHLKKNR